MGGLMEGRGPHSAEGATRQKPLTTWGPFSLPPTPALQTGVSPPLCLSREQAQGCSSEVSQSHRPKPQAALDTPGPAGRPPGPEPPSCRLTLP